MYAAQLYAMIVCVVKPSYTVPRRIESVAAAEERRGPSSSKHGQLSLLFILVVMTVVTVVTVVMVVMVVMMMVMMMAMMMMVVVPQ
jgi:hypothetical protein